MTGVFAAMLVTAGIAVLVAQLLRRRQSDAPTQPVSNGVPSQVDRSDFVRPEAPWLVAAFTSDTCNSCGSVVSKVEVLASDSVAVEVVSFQARQGLHVRYGIDAVPTVIVADASGVVRQQFVGPPSATDLWAAVAELREPGSTPPPEAHVRPA